MYAHTQSVLSKPPPLAHIAIAMSLSPKDLTALVVPRRAGGGNLTAAQMHVFGESNGVADQYKGARGHSFWKCIYRTG